MPSYKLLYFQARGAAEIPRLVFAAAGKEYEDVRISREDWPGKKPDMPLKAMPVLEIDGKKFCQGAAISRYLAREFGLMGKDNMEAFRIDELLEAAKEFFDAFFKIHFETDEKKKEELKKTVHEETLPKFCAFFEMRLSENDDGNGYVVGKQLSLGDLLLYNSMAIIKEFSTKFGTGDPFVKYPKLQGLYSRIGAEKTIADWVKKRPVTEF